jgi:hypothetical protein
MPRSNGGTGPIHPFSLMVLRQEVASATVYEESTTQQSAFIKRFLRSISIHHCSVSGKERAQERYSHCGKVETPQSLTAVRVEESSDSKDALRKKGDQLKKQKLLWILEIFPTQWQDGKVQWFGQ